MRRVRSEVRRVRSEVRRVRSEVRREVRIELRGRVVTSNWSPVVQCPCALPACERMIRVIRVVKVVSCECAGVCLCVEREICQGVPVHV